MPYIAPEVITEAKRMDLLTYLRTYELYQRTRQFEDFKREMDVVVERYRW